METDKKKIIAGAGLLGVAGLAYILSRKGPPTPPPPPPQTYKCPHCGETFATLAELQAHIADKHHEEPPVQFGYVTGTITSTAGAKIAGATITLNNDLDCHSDANGVYRTNNFGYGSLLAMVVQADNYQTYVKEDITINAAVMTLNIQLAPLVIEGDWIADVSVQKVTVTPAVIYLGQEVEVKIDISYRCGAPRPQTTPGQVHIDGEILSDTFVLEYYNPTFYFHYTPQMPGTYTISSGGSGTVLTVLREGVGTYYSPFGGIKWPLVTDIIIPDVAPFDTGSFVHPGGDLKYSDIIDANIWRGYQMASANDRGYRIGPVTWFPIYPPLEQITSRLSAARPAATSIPGCLGESYVLGGYTFRGYDYSLPAIAMLITSAENCPQTWDSKDELAVMIGKQHPRGFNTGEPYPNFLPFAEWDQYGKIDPYKGIKDWIIYLGIGYGQFLQDHGDHYEQRYYYYITCPYCGEFRSADWGPHEGPNWSEEDRIAFARQFLAHIESSHPTHPLMEPAWF